MMTLDDVVVGPIRLELLLLLGALLVFLVDLAFPRTATRAHGYIAAGTLLAVFVASFNLDTTGAVFGGAYVGGAWPLFFKRVFLAAGFLVMLGGSEHVAKHQPHRQAEYYLLLMFSILGMMLLPGARDLILLVVCFELMGIPLYILTAYAKTEPRPRGAGTSARATAPEAALKLYLVGSASTAITLFGLSLVVGLSGSTTIEALSVAQMSPLLGVGMMMILAGIGFKIGVVPFHMWVPDAYQGSSTPFVAFLSVAPKGAGLAALFTLFHGGFAPHAKVWTPVLLALTAATLVVGNLGALPQSNIKRLLGYSGVAQIGYMLMAFADGTAFSAGMVLFYFAAYTVTNIGAFLVVEAVSASAVEGSDDQISDLNGLYRRSPGMAFAMVLFLLSLAGIPFVAGFWAKLYVFMAAWQAGYTWLVLLGSLFAVVALFYYLQVVRAMYMLEPSDSERVEVNPATVFSIGICLLAVVGMGLFPGPFVEGAQIASRVFFD